MTRDEATERAARHAVRLFTRASGAPDWDERPETSRQCWRADIFEILDESGYPAALDEAAEHLRSLLSVDLLADWRDVEPARAWLDEHDEQTT